MQVPGKRLAVAVAGVSAVILAGAVSLSLKDLQRAYRISSMQRKPGFLAEALRAPEGTEEWAALRAFIRRPEGRTALAEQLAEVLLECEGTYQDSNSRLDTLRGFSSLQLGAIGRMKHPNHYWWSFRSKVGDNAGMIALDRDLFRVVWDSFEVLHGIEMTCPRFPDLSFELETLKDCPRFRGADGDLIKNPIVLFHAGEFPALVIWRRS
jgi:hypothetical protein